MANFNMSMFRIFITGLLPTVFLLTLTLGARVGAVATLGRVLATVTAGVRTHVELVTEGVDELADLIERHIKKGGAGEFTMPGLLKIKTVKKPARKAQKGVPNPFRPGETMDIAAKPASTRVKVLPLKGLKDFV